MVSGGIYTQTTSISTVSDILWRPKVVPAGANSVKLLEGAQVNEIVNQQTSLSKELDVVLEAYLAVEPPCVSPVPSPRNLS